MFRFAQPLLNDPQYALRIMLTTSGDKLNILWINDKPIAIHAAIIRRRRMAPYSTRHRVIARRLRSPEGRQEVSHALYTTDVWRRSNPRNLKCNGRDPASFAMKCSMAFEDGCALVIQLTSGHPLQHREALDRCCKPFW